MKWWMLNFPIGPFMSPDGAGGGDGGSSGGDAGDGTGTGDDDGGTSGDGKGDDKDGDKAIPQKDVNNIVARESKKAVEKALKELGIEDFKDAKDGMKKFKEWQDAQKSETEKAAEAKTKAEQELAKKQAELDKANALNAALSAGADPKKAPDAVILALAMGEDEGTIEERIAKVLDRHPSFKPEEGNPGNFSGGHRGNGGGNASIEAEVAQYMGVKSPS